MYKGNISKILMQTNLEENCLDKFLRSKVLKIMQNHQTSIKSKNLNAAFEKVDEIKTIAGSSIMKMQDNMETT